ncbi:Aste57867_1127 [Aphanomyces stellatus]|uniref:Aste57867_1127 protein n=1 Tax=Aphanomyces stellatus TaxID=120398 RepID=A0A485K7S3_9STRA|nr:hypothetical protein As57867_001126 [Aphanomyces stellatus]VFT78348.1 Aste57867_1127 [Aphanomyces stellatus]
MVDQLDAISFEPSGLHASYSLQRMSRLLLDGEIALVSHAIQHVQGSDGALKRKPDETYRYTLTQHTTFVQLTGVLTHIQEKLRESDTLAMNLVQSLGHAILLHESPATTLFPKAPCRAFALFQFLHRCHTQALLAFFLNACHGNNKSMLLRALLALRDLSLAIIQTHDGSLDAVDSSKWLLLLQVATSHATTFSVVDGTFLPIRVQCIADLIAQEHDRKAPTKLSLAAADSAFAISNVIALHHLAIPVHDVKRGEAAIVMTCFQELVDELTRWYGHVHHRALFLSALTSLTSFFGDSNRFAWHFHQSALLFQSNFTFSSRRRGTIVPRILHQLKNATCSSETTLAALRNLVCALGRLKQTALDEPTQLMLLEVVHTNLLSDCIERQHLALDVLGYRINDAWALDPSSAHLPPPWKVLDSLVRAMLAAKAVTSAAAMPLLTFHYPLSKLQTALESTETSETELGVLLTLVSTMVHASSASWVPSSWFHLLGQERLGLPLSAAQLCTEITPSIWLVFLHHPSEIIRRHCGRLLPSLDLHYVVSACVSRLPSATAARTCEYLVVSRGDKVVPLLLTAIQNVGFDMVSTALTSPAGIYAPTQLTAAAHETRQGIAQACARWVGHVNTKHHCTVTDAIVRTFFQSPQDATSMMFLREIFAAFPVAFATALPTVFAKLKAHATSIYAPSSDMLLVKLRPLLALRMAPVRGFQNDNVTPELTALLDLLLVIMCEDREIDDIRKLAADIVAKFPPQTTLALVLGLLQPFLNQHQSPTASLLSLSITSSSDVPRHPVSAKTTSLLVYCLSCFLVNHATSHPVWLTPVLLFVFGVWSISLDDKEETDTTMSLVERVQRGAIECLTVVLDHASLSPDTSASSVAAHGVVQLLLAVFATGTWPSDAIADPSVQTFLATWPSMSSAMGRSVRLCCCNVLLNVTPRLKTPALARIVTQALPTLYGILRQPDGGDASDVLSPCLKLVMAWTKHGGMALVTTAETTEIVRRIWLATARLVVAAPSTQVSIEAAQTLAFVRGQRKSLSHLITFEFEREMTRTLHEARDTNPDADVRAVAAALVDATSVVP